MEGCGGSADQALEEEDIEERRRGNREGMGCGEERQPQGQQALTAGSPGCESDIDIGKARLRQPCSSVGVAWEAGEDKSRSFSTWGPGEGSQTCSEPLFPHL